MTNGNSNRAMTSLEPCHCLQIAFGVVSASLRLIAVMCVIVFSNPTIIAAIQPEFLMDSDPAFPVPEPVKKFHPALKKLWLEALNRPEIDMRRLAAETIARGTKFGVPGLEEAIPTLERILSAEETHPATRFVVARALIDFDSRQSAEKLLEASQRYGSDLRQLVEPALAEWDFAPARQVWISRLDGKRTQRRDLFLALRGLGHVRESLALPTLLKITNDLVEGSDVRLEAAAAAGQIAGSGLESDSQRLSRESRAIPTINRLCAIHLLSRHDSEESQRLLVHLASDPEPSVAVAALIRLNEIDYSLVLPLAPTAINSRDQRVREQGALSYLMRPTVERIDPLCQMLNDPHPAVRRQICDGLLKLAQDPELKAAILNGAAQVLNGEHWQGQEQAALLLASVNHKPVANRLVQLLESPRPEVMIATAWALRKLAVPSTVPGMIDRATRLTTERRSHVRPGLDAQVAHLFETFGVLRAAEAGPLMKQYVPYDAKENERSRGAAIWALGLIYEGQNDPSLAGKLTARIEDESSNPPESQLVKVMCVVTLVRMKSVEQMTEIRDYMASHVQSSPFGLANRWGLKELLNVDLPEPPPRIADQGSWFLEPLP